MASLAGSWPRLGMAGVAASAVGLAGLGLAWYETAPPAVAQSTGHYILALGLIATLVISYLFPIPVTSRSKVYASGTALFLLAALLPPVAAACAIGIGILVGELAVARRTGNLQVPTVIPTQVARWLVVGGAGSFVAHLHAAAPPLALCGCAATLWTGDVVTGPFLLCPLVRKGALQVMRMMAIEGGVFEALQYAVALPAALAAESRPWTLLLFVLPAIFVYKAFERSRVTQQQTRRMLTTLADAVDGRDASLDGHSRRVASLVEDVLALLPVPAAERDDIMLAARLHDVGKVSLPDDLLWESDASGPAGNAVVRTHPVRGANMIEGYPELQPVARIVRHHRERWDGQGYPQRLSGEDIPLGSRIIAVAEYYDALTHSPDGVLGLSRPDALAQLRRLGGSAFDPAVVDTFLKRLDEVGEESPGLRLVT
ncbi:MAG TPA: HD domain-containing phosphohydrolase [Chloroflexota bacterium]|nr:HD domain-containing phosphohydrolase [Chloroflexota bacterium]